MQAGRSSRTAEYMALFRALEQLRAPEQRLFADPFARHFLSAPLRLVILDNSLPNERGAAQGLLSNFTSIGRLLGAAFVGSIAASAGGGAIGYQAAFVGMAFVAVMMVVLGVSLKSRRLPALENAESSAAA